MTNRMYDLGYYVVKPCQGQVHPRCLFHQVRRHWTAMRMMEDPSLGIFKSKGSMCLHSIYLGLKVPT